MTTMYYVELGQLVWDNDDDWDGPTDTWPDFIFTVARTQAYYPEHRYWMGSAGDATSDVMDYFGIDWIEAVSDDALETKWKGQYGIVSACEMPDDYADTLVDGEEISASGEQYVSYDRDDVHICAIRYGSISHFEY